MKTSKREQCNGGKKRKRWQFEDSGHCSCNGRNEASKTAWAATPESHFVFVTEHHVEIQALHICAYDRRVESVKLGLVQKHDAGTCQLSLLFTSAGKLTSTSQRAARRLATETVD